MIFGPLKEPTDKKRTGNTCSTTELPRHLEPEAGLEPATTRLGGDNPILRPVEMVKDGQEAASMFLDGNRTRIFSFSRAALTQLSCQFDNQSTTAHPKKKNDGQKARWESISCPMVRGLNALAVSRFADNPYSAARRNWRARWESNPRLPNFFGCSIAVELRDCPRVRANFERRSRMRFCCRLGRFRWASGVIERRHSMPGIEPGPPRLSPRTVRPPYGGG